MISSPGSREQKASGVVRYILSDLTDLDLIYQSVLQQLTKGSRRKFPGTKNRVFRDW
ncbi:hypothetical protein Pan241w_13370 [Gimesia alba]|uniref:Uncharacterized protein n=1 Tax=Gimesia alba TaxID=2527973 RepID=A0A517RBL3_9PLAN|nr:hypothetical protein Pan241w_13370 [Gimesia alba]